MVDSSWDNSGLPPKKAGMPTWAKVLLGCGLVFLLLIGSCVGLAAWGFHKASTMGQAQWPRYIETVKALQDPAATRALYDANPALKHRYPDADAFEATVARWRPAIQTPPAQMPPLTSGRAVAFGGRSTRVENGNVSHENGGMAGYKMEDGRMLVVVWRDQQVAEIEFDKNDR